VKLLRFVLLGVVVGAVVLLAAGSELWAQPSPRDHDPRLIFSSQVPLDSIPWRETLHTINRMELAVSNRGTLGKQSGFYDGDRDYFTGDLITAGCYFPRGSKHGYLGNINLRIAKPAPLHPAVDYGYIWSPDWGSPLCNFVPDDPPGTMTRRSITDRFGAPDPNAVSEEDIVCHYTDSMQLKYGNSTAIIRESKNPRAIGFEVDQESYGWSMEYAEDIILVTFDIRNYSDTVQRDVYVGLNILPRPEVYLTCYPDGNIFGLRRAAPSIYGCGFVDTVDVVWNASVSGNPIEGLWVDKPRWNPAPDGQCYYGSVRGVLGVMPLQTPVVGVPPNYNWWAYGYDPNGSGYYFFEPCRSGTPLLTGDYYLPRSPEEIYRLMSTHEVDPPTYLIHDIYTNPLNHDWLPVPAAYANEVTTRGGWEENLSWGPLVFGPGGTTRLTIAVVGGEKLHNFTNNKFNLPFRANQFYDSLDFSDFNRNLTMAQWIYDNPGVDTDGDGYFGEYRVCVHDSSLIDGNWVATRADTQWYKGDGIPDYRGALPPPSPELWVSQIQDGLHIRFNGQYSETEKDIFMQVPDWEGYRIYLGRDERHESLSLVGSYDKLDYDKLYFNQTLIDGPQWQLIDRPFTVEQLRCLYGTGVGGPVCRFDV